MKKLKAKVNDAIQLQNYRTDYVSHKHKLSSHFTQDRRDYNRTLVLVSTLTSRELILVERIPAMHSPAKGLKKLRPGWAMRSKRPHFSTTPTLDCSMQPHNTQYAFPIIPTANFPGREFFVWKIEEEEEEVHAVYDVCR